MMPVCFTFERIHSGALVQWVFDEHPGDITRVLRGLMLPWRLL